MAFTPVVVVGYRHTSLASKWRDSVKHTYKTVNFGRNNICTGKAVPSTGVNWDTFLLYFIVLPGYDQQYMWKSINYYSHRVQLTNTQQVIALLLMLAIFLKNCSVSQFTPVWGELGQAINVARSLQLVAEKKRLSQYIPSRLYWDSYGDNLNK